ncbi:MAG: NapC/NirT family cytochrome c [Candidatus Omnitrophica bacterium]|nr:hypothetical protein [bacterium]NUN97731.1 NapC/NirT family cytochrome c [Candidatus Omnitrophota bacterium]
MWTPHWRTAEQVGTKLPGRGRESGGWRFALSTGIFWLGAILVAMTLTGTLVLVSLDLIHGNLSPHERAAVYLIAPVLLGAGVSLLALLRAARLLKRTGGPGKRGLPRVTIDLGNRKHAKTLALSGLGGAFLIGLVSLGGYQSYHFTESTEFCGIVCHEVMNPHFVTHQNSAHAEVGCVECHVGDGAEWYLRTKLNGLQEVRAYLTGSYELPIKSPLRNLRPPRDTCEKCHWPEKFIGNSEKTITHFSREETSAPYSIRLLLKVGGGEHGASRGIHWHVSGGNKVEYIAADETRREIPWVKVTDSAGRVTVYRSTQTDSGGSLHESREMDCVDCHNRPTHAFEDPDSAVNEALRERSIDPALPDIKDVAMALLEEAHGSTPEAMKAIEGRIRERYSTAELPEAATRETAIAGAITALQKIYARNFFPEGRVDWSTHPDFIGHFRWDGCFRCHDGEHVSEDGRTISNDCSTCHLIVGQGEGLGELSELPYQVQEFIHPPDGEPMEAGTRCVECHGAPPATEYSPERNQAGVIAAAD